MQLKALLKKIQASLLLTNKWTHIDPYIFVVSKARFELSPSHSYGKFLTIQPPLHILTNLVLA